MPEEPVELGDGDEDSEAEAAPGRDIWVSIYTAAGILGLNPDPLRAGVLLFMAQERSRFCWDMIASVRSDIHNTAGKVSKRTVRPHELHPFRPGLMRVTSDNLRSLPFGELSNA